MFDHFKKVFNRERRLTAHIMLKNGQTIELVGVKDVKTTKGTITGADEFTSYEVTYFDGFKPPLMQIVLSQIAAIVVFED